MKTETATTATSCPWCKKPADLVTIREGDEQFVDEYGIGCQNNDCSFRPFAIGFASKIEALEAWNKAGETS